MVKVNVAAFGHKMPNKIAISNTAPPGVTTLQTIVKDMGDHYAVFKHIIPEHELWLDYKAGRIDWDTFEKCYKIQIKYIRIDRILKRIAKWLCVDEITLCCYEAENDEKCHRKMLFDRLPDEMKGERK